MLFTLGVLVLLAAPAAGSTAPDGGASMRGMFEALVGLEPYLAHPELLRDPKNERDVTAKLDLLASVKHVFPGDPKAQEPATAALSALFARYAADTRRHFAEGDLRGVPMRVRTLVSLCLSCHSRERVPVDFADVDKRVDAMNLSPFDRAQYLAATRQFDRALTLSREQLRMAPQNEAGLLEYSRLLRDTLALLVRVKDDAIGAAALLDELGARKDLPPFVQRSIATWRKDVAAWQAERFDALKASPDQLFAKAKALVDKANGPRTFYPDETTDMLYLRASGYLNLALGKDPRHAKRGEALFLLGLCAAALKSPLLWDVDLLYFETCVRENAHSKLAKQCFRQLSDRVYFGYTGSSGTNIPEDELQRLSELRALVE